MPKLSIDVELKLAQVLDGLKSIEQTATRTAKQVDSSFAGVGKAFQSLRAFATGGLIGGFFTSAIKAALDAETASKRLEATLKATGNAAGLTKRQIDDLADSLASTTNFDDEGIRNAATELVKFGNISGQAFTRALKAASDWAAFSGKDIPEAAREIGVAIAGTDASLGRLERQLGGLTYAEEQFIKSLQDSGDLLGAQNEKLRIIESRVGGVASAMTKGFGGALKDVAKQFNEMLEGFGKIGTEGGLFEKMLRGLASLLRDITAESQGTRTPLRNLAEDLALSVPVLRQILALSNAIKAIGQIAGPQQKAGPGVSGRITDPGGDEARAQAAAAAKAAQAWEDAALKRGDEADKKLLAEMKQRQKEAARLAETEEKRAREKDLDGLERYLNERYDQAYENTRALAKLEQDRWRAIDDANKRAIESDEEAARIRSEINEQRYIDEGQITLRKMHDEQEEEAKRLKDVARDLGLTFQSAFEDAVVAGKSFQDVLRGIADDIIRIATRKLITEPLMGALSTAISSAFGGGGGGGAVSLASGTDFVPRDMLAYLHKGEQVVPASENNGGSGLTVNVIGAQGPVQATRRQDSSGLTLDLIVGQLSQQQAGDIGSGRGPLAAMLERTYGLSRVPGSYR